MNTIAKKDPTVKAAKDSMPAKEAGILALSLQLDPKKGTLFNSLVKTVSNVDRATKVEVWMTYEEMCNLKGETNVNKWIDSGRVAYRHDSVADVYEYMDTHNFTREKAFR